MSVSITYLPVSDADKLVWLNNFNTKIPIHAAILGISPAEVTAIQNDAAYFQYVINMVDAHKQSLNTLVAYKNMLKHAVGQQHIGALPAPPVLGTPPTAVSEGIFDRVSKFVQRIKASTNYTDSMGQDLGIIAPGTSTDLNSLQPDLIVKLDVGRPHIKCKKGRADAIDLYVDRNDGAGFILIGRLLKTEFIDTAALPASVSLAEWDYKAMYVIGNNPVGLMSAVVSIIVKKQ